MRILITGINGFVGSNLTNEWKYHYTMYGLDICQQVKEGVEHIFSWEEMGKIPSVDAIIHLAGKAHDTKNLSEAKTYFDINTGLTQKIFDYFLQSDTRTFIFFSSVKAAADQVQGNILTEEVAPHPVGPYGESKIKAEEYILRAKSQEPRAMTKNIYILRPCMIHGPGNKGNLNLLYNIVRKGIPWPLGVYENQRSFCSMDNITYVVEQLIERDNIESGIYQIGDDEPLSTNELIRLIGKSVNKKTCILKFPKIIIKGMACIGNTLHLPFNKQRLQKLTENYIVSNKKIKNALGIDNMPVSVRDGMKRTLESFREL